eukprot:m.212301 g.212301  ORF g.212301 m.212301 type:complete len:109 (-) comp19038_c0_seq2:1915-2241(-)
MCENPRKYLDVALFSEKATTTHHSLYQQSFKLRRMRKVTCACTESCLALAALKVRCQVRKSNDTVPKPMPLKASWYSTLLRSWTNQTQGATVHRMFSKDIIWVASTTN